MTNLMINYLIKDRMVRLRLRPLRPGVGRHQLQQHLRARQLLLPRQLQAQDSEGLKECNQVSDEKNG